MSVETEDAFQKELLELFVHEAQEWLQQIHVALDELQQSPSFERHRALARTIKIGITNLGGSAATLNLNDVEQASFATLPLIEVVQDPSARISTQDFIALCKQLGHIQKTLTRTTGVAFDTEPISVSDKEAPPKMPTKELLVLLRGLRNQRTAIGSFQRNLVEAMVAQAEGMLRRGVDQCDLASIQEFLDQLAEGEEEFLRVVRQELPHLTTILQTLKHTCIVSDLPSSDLHHAVERVSRLWSAAQQVTASHAMVFFMGLHGFLTIVRQHRVAVSAKTYDAIQARLGQSVKNIEEWVESGRMERLAIHSALPH
jgi:chemotaxis protein histidine kinase CheA